MRLTYIATNLLKNTVAPVVLRLTPGRGSLGMDGDLMDVLRALDRLAAGIEPLARPLAGLDVLELGPGRTREVSVAMLLCGAASACTLDTSDQLTASAKPREPYRELAEALAGNPPHRFLLASGSAPEEVWERVPPLSAGTSGVRHLVYGGSEMPLPDRSVDLIVSKSVLEHVPERGLEALVREMRRVLRPDGGLVHSIDLRDHMWIAGDGVTGDWLDALRYPRKVFRAMFGNRSTAINRLRSCEWRALLEQQFEVLRWEPWRYALPKGFDPARLARRWHSLPREELSIGQIDVTLRVPS